MQKQFFLTFFSALALFCGQFVFLGCETESADDPEFSGSIESSTNSTDSVSSDRPNSNDSGSSNQNNSSNNSDSSADLLSWKSIPEFIYKGEIVTVEVVNNVGTINWAISPTSAATISKTNDSSAIIMTSATTDATSIRVTATDQTTKKSLSADIPLT